MVSVEKYDWVLEYFRTSGRINRRTYIFRVLGRWALFLPISFINFSFIMTFENLVNYSINGYSLNLFATSLNFIFSCLLVILFLLYLYIAIAQEIKRLHDLNSSGWWVLARGIPLAGIIYFIILIVASGTAGENKYGLDPNKKYKDDEIINIIKEGEDENEI